MNRMTATILSIAMSVSAGWAADPPEKKEVPLPLPVVKADEAMEAAVNKASAAYLKVVDAEVKKMQAVLEKEKQTATKAGNLELAMAIKAKQEALTVDAVVAKAGEKVDFLEGANPFVKGSLRDKALLKFLGNNANWTLGDKFLKFDVKEMTISIGIGEKVTYAAPFSIDGQVVKWQDNRIEFADFDGSKALFKWTGVSPQDLLIKQ